MWCLNVCVCVVWFDLLIIFFFAGNTEAECDASDGTTVKCKFSKDINSTKTDFVLYFYYDNGKSGTSPVFQSLSRFSLIYLLRALKIHEYC